MPIFEPSTSIAAVATSKSKLEDVQKQLRALSFDVTVLDIVNEADEAESEAESEEASSEAWSEVNGSDAELR